MSEAMVEAPTTEEEDDSTTKESKRLKDLLASAKDNYESDVEAWSHNRTAALEDIKFRNLDQWPEEIKKARGKKPCLTVDKINQYIRQVVNDGRQNRPGVKVRPIDDRSDDKAAEAFQGTIRRICNASSASAAFDTALNHAAGSGFGYIRVTTEYAHGKTLNQEIRIRRVRNPLAVVLGPHYLADGSDAERGFFLDDVPKDTFKQQFPKAKEVDWDAGGYGDGWSTDKTIRVCEYFYKVDVPVTLFLLVDGTCVPEEEYTRSVEQQSKLGPFTPPQIEEKRTITGKKVKHCRFSGAEVLEENDWLGKYIPILPVYGNEDDLEGKVYYSGLVRGARDPQMLYNFGRSMFAERVALSPKAPWLLAEGQAEGHEDQWKTANSGDHAALFYKVVDVNGHPIPAPQRIDPSDVPAGFARDMEIAEHDIQASMGMYAASVGERSNEKSGKAIMARQREGDTATFHYQDNLNRAIEYLGRILVDLIPKVYDSRRLIRLLGEDGTVTPAMIDPSLTKASERRGAMMVYNLGVGQYDVELEAGPSYTTRRVESAEAMIELVRANPQMWQTHGDLIVKAQDWPGADEFARRSKLTLPPELRQAAGDGQEDPDVAAAKAETLQLKQQAQQAIDQRDQALQQAAQHIQTLEQQLKDKGGEVAAKVATAETGQFKAETERMVAIEPAMTPENIALIVQQTVAAILAAPPQQPPPPPGDSTQAPSGAFFTP